jgi:hypothetical protein
VIGVATKKKTRKLGMQKHSLRREERAVHAKRRGARSANGAEHRVSPWLRILPDGIENDPPMNSGRGFPSQRNGRREPQGLNLSIREDDLHIRREFL